MADYYSVFVDSNYFIALFNTSDALHSEATSIAESMVDQNVRLYISNYIMIEVLTVLSQRVGKRAATLAIDSLSNDEQIKTIHITKELHQQSLDIFRSMEPKNVSLVDCSILAILDYVNIKQLLTFDITDFKSLASRFNFKFFNN
jgi:predicted nucleic acid-binding protein